MPKKPSPPLPVAVLVARWSALAAAATAIGSFLNTMWTSEPWWVKHVESAPKMATAHAAAPAAGGSGLDMMLNVAGTPPDPSLYEKALMYLQHHQVSAILIAGSGLIFALSVGTEYIHRRSAKRAASEGR